MSGCDWLSPIFLWTNLCEIKKKYAYVMDLSNRPQHFNWKLSTSLLHDVDFVTHSIQVSEKRDFHHVHISLKGLQPLVRYDIYTNFGLVFMKHYYRSIETLSGLTSHIRFFSKSKKKTREVSYIFSSYFSEANPVLWNLLEFGSETASFQGWHLFRGRKVNGHGQREFSVLGF